MGTDLIIPEIVLLEKMEETDHSFAPALWEGLKAEVITAEQAEAATLSAPVRRRRQMFFRDFVNKAISQPITSNIELTEPVKKQLYRLHLFCCQQSIHSPEVRRNPLLLAFHALNEMKLALMGLLITYRLIDPSCPYKWTHAFFENNILTHKDVNGHIIINFRNIPTDIVNAAITEELITDWQIYRGYGHNGIRTLMDVKNHLQTLPNFKRGGHPADEFSRFERKMREQFNRKQLRKDEALDLEFRKTLVRTVAEQTASQMIASGMSTQDILAQAFAADISNLTCPPATPASNTPPQSKKNTNALSKSKQDTDHIENIISHFLEEK